MQGMKKVREHESVKIKEEKKEYIRKWKKENKDGKKDKGWMKEKKSEEKKCD